METTLKKCVYVVEDNANIREIIEFLLAEENYLVQSYPNINLFWQQMKNETPDFIVLDVMLPDGNGIEVCTRLKMDVKTHHIPVMMMSANNNLNKIKSKCTAETFINKPFDINDFIKRIDHFCQAS